MLNPWVLLGIVVFYAASLIGSYNFGVDVEGARRDQQDLQLQIDRDLAAAQAKDASLTKEREAIKDQRATQDRHAAQLLERDSALADARNELRRAEANRVRPLASAASAPAICRDYEARPTDLPLRDKEFLVGRADAADRAVVQLGACQSEIRTLRKAFGLDTEITTPATDDAKEAPNAAAAG